MSNTYVQNLLHVVFSTKDRQKLIAPESQARLWAFLAGVCKRESIYAHAIGGMEDHAHMLIQLPSTNLAVGCGSRNQDELLALAGA